MANNPYGSTAIINGKRVAVPNAGGYIKGSEVKQMATGGKAGRRAIIENTSGSGKSFKTIDENKLYYVDELTGKNGKISSIPDRTKGSTFTGNRTHISKNIITEQVYDIASKLFRDGITFDEEGANWMVVPTYKLPQNWHHIAKTTPLLIKFPDNYPSEPPIGFYMKADIPESANGHFFNAAYHEADKEPLSYGWKWYCVYVPAGQWNPAPIKQRGDWNQGDNIWTYFKLIAEVLESHD